MYRGGGEVGPVEKSQVSRGRAEAESGPSDWRSVERVTGQNLTRSSEMKSERIVRRSLMFDIVIGTVSSDNTDIFKMVSWGQVLQYYTVLVTACRQD